MAAVIHYCWFGGEKPEKVRRCIESWKRFEPKCEIIEHGEMRKQVRPVFSHEDFGYVESEYFRRAIAAKQWAFAADYARLKVLEAVGGVYLDTDIEMKAPIVEMMTRHRLTLSFEKNCVQGCVIGCESHHPFIQRLLAEYDRDVDIGIPGHEPKSIVTRITDLLIDEYGLRSPFGEQTLREDIHILPANRLLVDMQDGENLAVHHYAASWTDEFDADGFVRDVKRYCDWPNASIKFRVKERIKMFLQYRLPCLYRIIRDRKFP